MNNPRVLLSAAGLVLGLVCVSGSAVAATFPRFETHVIGTWGNRLGQTALVDIDQDGDLDWVVGQSGTLSWFEYRGPDDWLRHDLGQGARTDVGGTAFDVDGDGWVDVVTGTGWYRNPRNPRRRAFTFFPTGAISSHDNVAADIDGDGRLDVVACSNDRQHVRLAWYSIPADPRKPWTEHVIGEGIHGGVDPAGVGDLDGDGDADVVRGDVWFENLDGKGTRWQSHATLVPDGGSRVGPFGLCLKTWLIDLDQDGDLDVIQAEADFPDCRVFWFENLGRAASWRFHLISRDSTGQDFHSLAVADFDNDGDPDVFSGGGPLSQRLHASFIWENLDGKGGAWREHLLLSGERCHEARAADVDGDGDIDICTKPWNGSRHLFLRNRLIDTPPPGADRES